MKNKRNLLAPIATCEPVIHGVLKIAWNDGFEDVVDLRPTVDRGRVVTYLRQPENFQKVQVSEYGHSNRWIDNHGNEFDFGADSLLAKPEKQAKLHKLVANMQF